MAFISISFKMCNYRQEVFSVAIIFWLLSFCVICVAHYAPDYALDAPYNAVITAGISWAAIYKALWRHTDGLHKSNASGHCIEYLCSTTPFQSPIHVHMASLHGGRDTGDNYLLHWGPWRWFNTVCTDTERRRISEQTTGKNFPKIGEEI